MRLFCPNCTYLNDSGAVECNLCLESLVGSGKESVTSESATTNTISFPPFQAEEGEEGTVSAFLLCTRCTFHNSITAEVCMVCGHCLDESAQPTSPRSHSSCTSEVSKTENGVAMNSGASESIQDGLIPLLEEALVKQQGSFLQQERKKRRLQSPALSVFRLCSPLTPHVTQRGVQEGVHWSCGYRNIQMICLALQRMHHDVGSDVVLFDSGDVPSVAGLQVWIERAWRAGFDPLGCQQLGGCLLGTEEWIGATECASLLRFMGLRAEIVDFHLPLPPPQSAGSGAADSALLRWVVAYFDRQHSFLRPTPSSPSENGGASLSTGSCCGSGGASQSGDSRSCSSSASSHSPLPSLPPLYFQHQGHSRTIVGYEQTGAKFFLLLFDPSCTGTKLRLKLEQGSGWQVMVKRGAHTLTKRQYQIVYVAPGALLRPGSREYEEGKELKSTVFC